MASNPARVEEIKRLMDTLENNPEDSPEYIKARKEFDTLLFGLPTEEK